MLDTGIGTLYLFLAFSLIGVGPAFIISQTVFDAVAIAPILGVTAVTLMGTYLVYFNFPVMQWAYLLFIAGAAFSVILFLYTLKKPLPLKLFLKWPSSEAKLFIVGGALTSVCLLLPMLVGGLRFTVFRGNGIDAFNYLSIAGLLQHEPYAWAKTTSASLLAAKNPTYPWGQSLLETRWSTSMLLAWSSSITRLPLYRLEHGFTILFFLMTYSVGSSLARLLSFKPYQAFLMAMSLSLGFWAQWVLDIRAMSEISVLPILLGTLILIIHISERPKTRLQKITLSLVLAALSLLYIEIVPFVVLAMMIFVLLQKWHPKKWLEWALRYLPSFLIAVLLILPLLKDYLWHFFMNQLVAAVHDQNNWYLAYFHWLYARPLFNFWGIALWAHAIASHPIVFIVLKNGICFLSLLLFIILFYGSIQITFSKKTSLKLKWMMAFLLASLVQFLYLCCHHQWWAAGKALSYGYPFIMFVPAMTGFILLPATKAPSWIVKTSQGTILIWLIMQCGLAGLRTVYAAHEKVYPHYILHHYDYLRHDWNVDALTHFLKIHHIKTIGLVVANPFLLQYLDFHWGWDLNILQGDLLKKNQPDYLVVSKTFTAQNHFKTLIQTPEFILIHKESKQWNY